MFSEVGYEHTVKTVRFTNMKGDEKKEPAPSTAKWRSSNSNIGSILFIYRF